MGGSLQVLRGWWPVAENTEHAEWDLDTIAKVAPQLFEVIPAGVPPFMPNIGDV